MQLLLLPVYDTPVISLLFAKEHTENSFCPFLSLCGSFRDLAAEHIKGFGIVKVNSEFKIPILGTEEFARLHPSENDNNMSPNLRTGCVGKLCPTSLQTAHLFYQVFT
jgi:hypothetical protein